ncbi:MAG: hypothetical protein ACRBFS_11050 [Aureispira sp.]
MSSFSLVPIEKKQLTKREQRLQKKEQRLLKRFDAAKTSRRKRTLQKRLQKVQHQLASGKSHPLGVWALVLGIIGIPLSLILLFVALIYGIGFPSQTMLQFLRIFGWITPIVGLTGFIISLVFLKRYKSFSEQYPLKKHGKAGLILCSIVLFFILLAILAAI